MPNAVTVSALLLLALAGGFLFAYNWRLTRYIALRLEGQQLLFMAVGFAVPLLILARLVLLGAPYVLSEYIISGVTTAWKTIVAPLNVPASSTALATFFTAFLLGPILGLFLHVFFWPARTIDRIIDRYGSGLEKLLNASIYGPLLLAITLDNRKAYVGYPGLTPFPQPRRDEADNYFGLLPIVSGCRRVDTLKLYFTTDYTDVYDQVMAGSYPGLHVDDFEITIPVDRVVTIAPFSLEMGQSAFDISSGQQPPQPAVEAPPASEENSPTDEASAV
jgi:hypothetical protein